MGIIVPDTTINFFPKVIQGAESAAREHGYSLIVANSTDDSERQRELISLMCAQGLDGILLAVADGPTPAIQLSQMREAGIPAVCVDRIPDGIELDSVSTGDGAAAELGIEHLLANGYRRIAIVTGPLTLKNEHQRLLGCEESLKRAGIASTGFKVWEGNLQPEDVEILCREKLRNPEDHPEAVFCTNGKTALGALRAIRESGLRIPEDTGFLTFDELTPIDDILRPGITTIIQPAYEMGFRAAEILLGRIAEGGNRATFPVTARLSASLKVRESSRGIWTPDGG